MLLLSVFGLCFETVCVPAHAHDCGGVCVCMHAHVCAVVYLEFLIII